MAWTPFKAVTDKATVGTGISVSLRGSKAGQAKMTINMRLDLVAGFGWADGDKLEVMLGEGEHHGLIRLRKNNSAAGSVELAKRSGARDSTYYTARLGHVPAYVNRSEPKRWVQFEAVEDGWVEFVLPLWADETSPRANKTTPGPTPKSPVAAAAAFQRPNRSATANLMGDPPAKRSALAAKA